MVTEDDLHLLKNQWLQDGGSWDIENTEGFEEHHDQLLAWRKQYEQDSAKRLEEKRNRLLGQSVDDLIYMAMDNQKCPDIASMYTQIAIAKALDGIEVSTETMSVDLGQIAASLIRLAECINRDGDNELTTLQISDPYE